MKKYTLFKKSISIIFLTLCIMHAGCEKQPLPKNISTGTSVSLLSQDEKEAKMIIELNEKLVKAYKTGDEQQLNQLLSEHHIHNNIFGQSLSKKEIIYDICHQILQFAHYQTQSIHVYKCNEVYIATGLIEATAQRGKKTVAGLFRFTRIFIKEQGEWKEFLFHNTFIQNTSA